MNNIFDTYQYEASAAAERELTSNGTKDRELTAIEFGEIWDINEREVRRLAEKGILEKSAPGRYPMIKNSTRYFWLQHIEWLKKSVFGGHQIHLAFNDVHQAVSSVEEKLVGAVDGDLDGEIQSLLKELQKRIVNVESELLNPF